MRRAVPLLVLGLLLALAPGAAAGTVKRVGGASTASAAYVEVKFKGKLDRRLKVKFVPTSGRATTIISRGTQTRRRGSRGFSQVVRAGRTVAVMVRGLPAVAGAVVATAQGRGDRKRARLRPLQTEAQLERELVRTDGSLRRLQAAKTSADYRSFDARKRAKRRRLNALRADLAARIEILDVWVKLVDKTLSNTATRECNDGADAGDPEDSLADFGFDKDPGCVMPLDNDEGDAPMTLTCPNPGGASSVTASLVIPQANTLERFVVSLPPPAPDEPRLPIVDQPVTGASGGPYALETGITQLCNYEFDFIYGYEVFTDGVASGNYGLRVTVSVTNNGGYPGGEQLPFRLAAGTTR